MLTASFYLLNTFRTSAVRSTPRVVSENLEANIRERTFAAVCRALSVVVVTNWDTVLRDRVG